MVKKIKKSIVYFFLLLAVDFVCFSQIIITPAASFLKNQQSTKTTTYNQLPFCDDFSNYEGIPNQNKWQSLGAIVNHNYQYNPPTVGVVTLDAMDFNGNLYSTASVSGFEADTLISQPIRLDSIFSPYNSTLTSADSIYFSFYFQPAGNGKEQWELIGSRPSSSDSLILEFFSPEDGWNWIWSSPGLSADSLYSEYGTYYKYVLIPITEDKFFTKEFRFRFRNIASLYNNPLDSYVGNCDQWNIDYVYLNKNRSFEDTTHRDLAFVDKAPSLLKRYQAMPARQFDSEEMADSLRLKIVNLYSQPLSSVYKFYIENEAGAKLYTYDGGFENIQPYSANLQYQTSANHAQPELTFVYDINPERHYVFDIVHTIKEGVGQDQLSANDTIVFKQIFKDYFAYDDGSAENGIGVEPNPGSHLAVRYELHKTDTLSAIDIYFNSSLNESNFKPFYICIWNCEENTPSEIIYKTEQLTPSSDSLNKFTRYVLKESIVLAQGKFFVSLQTKGSDYLNIGFDRNTNSAEYTFSKTSSYWQQSFEKGSVMMRPYFGAAAAVGLNSAESREISVYPNPSSSKLYFRNCENASKELFDINGRSLLKTKDNELNIEHLNSGVYILRIIDVNGSVQHTKIIKSK
jgi:hypothetical protein